MFNFQFDLSLNTVVITGAAMVLGYVMKGVTWALIEASQALIRKLVETISRVEILDEKMTQLTHAVGDVQKMRTDLNAYYDRLKKLENKFQNGT